MERFENQRWTAKDVARLIAVFESERRFYDEIVTTLPFPLATVSAEGVLLSANPAFLREFKLTSEDIDRRSLHAVFGDSSWKSMLMPYEPGTLQTRKHKVLLTPVPRWDRGEREWVVVFQEQISSLPEPPASASSIDLELAGNTAGVESAQRLAARVTHETNNLVMVAAGYGREILAQLPANSPLREDVSMLLSATERIESMAAQLNEYSRIGRSDLGTYKVRELLPAAGYAVAGGASDITVLTDRAALAAVFDALAMNAAGPLTVETASTAKEAVVTVKGFGMSAESLRHQFEILNKASREGKAGARECALVGPRLVQAGVRWRITEGSELEMHIPLAGQRPAPAGRTALVVDDQTGIRAIVRRILEGHGYQVNEAGSGEEALAVLDRRKEAYDLLVTDMRMPGMTGRDLAERVRFRHPATKILFISGFTDDPGVQSGILPDRSRFLAKPFHPDQFLEAITQLMQ